MCQCDSPNTETFSWALPSVILMHINLWHYRNLEAKGYDERSCHY